MAHQHAWLDEGVVHAVCLAWAASFPKQQIRTVSLAMSDQTDLSPRSGDSPPSAARPVPRAELAAHLAGRLCHDMISPVSAIVSGLDLLEDPSAQDMRDDAMSLIDQSARKLAAVLSFARVAYGSSASAETFDPGELEVITRGVFSHVRSELDWAVTGGPVDKPMARALLNLAQLGATALPTGGKARLTVENDGNETVILLEAKGGRARLRPEAQAGLRGEEMTEGLPGQWVQPYYLYTLVTDAGGRIESVLSEDSVVVRALLPRQA
jgi:histidine phosphotransferase ChpT